MQEDTNFFTLDKTTTTTSPETKAPDYEARDVSDSESDEACDFLLPCFKFICCHRDEAYTVNVRLLFAFAFVSALCSLGGGIIGDYLADKDPTVAIIATSAGISGGMLLALWMLTCSLSDNCRNREGLKEKITNSPGHLIGIFLFLTALTQVGPAFIGGIPSAIGAATGYSVATLGQYFIFGRNVVKKVEAATPALTDVIFDSDQLTPTEDTNLVQPPKPAQAKSPLRGLS